MHGTKKFDKQLPMYGNKLIGVMNGKLDIHGTPRNVTWTYLSQSVNVGDTTF